MTSEEACTGMAASSMVEYAELPADLLSSFHADPNDGFDEIALPLHFTDFMLRPGTAPSPTLRTDSRSACCVVLPARRATGVRGD